MKAKSVAVSLKRVGSHYKVARITNALTVSGFDVGDVLDKRQAQKLCDDPEISVNVSQNN